MTLHAHSSLPRYVFKWTKFTCLRNHLSRQSSIHSTHGPLLSVNSLLNHISHVVANSKHQSKSFLHHNFSSFLASQNWSDIIPCFRTPAHIQYIASSTVGSNSLHDLVYFSIAIHQMLLEINHHLSINSIASHPIWSCKHFSWFTQNLPKVTKQQWTPHRRGVTQTQGA